MKAAMSFPRITSSGLERATNGPSSNNSGNTNLKLRRQTQSSASLVSSSTSIVSSAANPQDLDDVECCGSGGINLVSSSSSTSSLGSNNDRCGFESDDSKDHDGDYSQQLGRRTAEYLSDLSPLSRRIVRFVTPKGDWDRCTSECLTVAAVRILPSFVVLMALPFLMWDSHPTDWSLFNLYPLFRHVDMVWSSLLHTSIWPIVVGTLLVAAVMPRTGLTIGGGSSSTTPPPKFNNNSNNTKITKGIGGRTTALSALITNITTSNWKMTLLLSILFNSFVIINMTLQMGIPHIAWNPYMWGWYTVYLPENIGDALHGACLDIEKHQSSSSTAMTSSSSRQSNPLCLSESQWNELSSGRLSSYNPDDVVTVQRGLDYLQKSSGGIIINAIARNVADNIPALQQNMEGLLPFLGSVDSTTSNKKLSLVIFENDSNDGTRELFQVWSDQENRRPGGPRYTVDLMSCGPTNPNCELGIMDRYDNMNLFTNPTASGVGKLGEFRQILLEYILGKEEYASHSHMVILDADLGTSLSPLGLIHTLGLDNGVAHDHAVASSSSQVWPGTMGTIIPPYDLSAFRPRETQRNTLVRNMHTSFCELMPAGDRWRNMCEACSPMQLFMIQSANDVSSHHDQPYEVVSAFNGLTVYPLDLIRQRGSKARYDAGDDGQRCEHVGFHLSLGRNMFVNPKWSMNLKPSKPGGPTGLRAIKTLVYAIFGRPNVMLCLVLGNLVFFYVVVSATWMIGTSTKRLCMLLIPGTPTRLPLYVENKRVYNSTDSSRDALFSFEGRARVDSGIDTREM